ncbi:4670_t:CDS:1, partial [Scutellospora calospora]
LEEEVKFLFVYDYPVSEGLAIQHMNSFIKLAQALDRIFVLPNVGESHIGSCQTLPFNIYYSIDFLRQKYPKVTFITQMELIEWSRSQSEYTKVHHAYIEKGGINTFVEIDNIDYKSYNTTCLYKQLLINYNMTSYQKFHMGKGFWKLDIIREKFTKILIDNLQTEAQIMLMSYNMYLDFFPEEISYSIYSKDILVEADRIINKLQPFIAIYLNVEFNKSTQLESCARHLVEALKKFEHVFKIKNIYFTTINKGTSIYDILIEHQQDMMKTLNQKMSFNNLISMESFNKNLTDAENLQDFDYVNFIEDIKEFEGTGIYEILDKLVSINADYFLADLSGCPSIADSFRDHVVKARKTMIFNEGNQKLKN